MRCALIGVWLALSMAAGAQSNESATDEPGQQPAASPDAAEEEADAEILDIEKSVSGADDVEEFVPKKPLSADKAIALPSDI
jgi:hypothetical protein